MSGPERTLEALLHRYPEYEDRIRRGWRMVDKVEPTVWPDLHLVIASNEKGAYQVDATSCSCADMQLRGTAFCKHRAARAHYLAREDGRYDHELR